MKDLEKIKKYFDNYESYTSLKAHGIDASIELGLDSETVSFFNKFNYFQSQCIWYGLKKNLDVTYYLNPDYDIVMMDKIIKIMENNHRENWELLINYLILEQI